MVKPLLIVFFSFGFFFCTAQTKVAYNKDLADSLGANAYGMKWFGCSADVPALSYQN